MSLTITVGEDAGKTFSCEIDQFPDKCPVCKNGGKQKFLVGYYSAPAPGRLWTSFLCPINACSAIYSAVYYNLLRSRKDMGWTLYEATLLSTQSPVKFSDEILHCSPRFCKIYTESDCAEKNGLSEIAGPGFRKSLEILIKDYLITSVYVNDIEMSKKIKGLYLSNCIVEHISNPELKDCAERATWLGNDETHYVKIWDEKDLKDLILLINITVAWIEMQIRTNRYRNDMKKNG